MIPCYNEAKRLRGQAILDFLEAHQESSVCFVDDGSSDGTLSLLEAIEKNHHEKILVVRLASNSGKAEAVRQGVLHAWQSRRFSFIGYWDADLSTPLGELEHILEAFARNPHCRLAMGSRVRRFGSSIERRLLRHVMGRVFSTVTSLILDLPVYDSQCGAKVFRSEVVEIVFGEIFLTDWLFDVEIIARLRNHFGRVAVLKAITEVPLTAWTDVGGSKLRAGHLIKVPIELLRIHARYNLKRPGLPKT